MNVDNDVRVAICLDDDVIIKHVLGTDKNNNDEEKERGDEDNMQTKKLHGRKLISFAKLHF